MSGRHEHRADGHDASELHFFINNGRSDITPEEQTTILTLTGKAMCFPPERKGQDGATYASVAYELLFRGENQDGEPVPFNGYPEGGSLSDYGLQGVVYEIPDADDGPERPEEPAADGRSVDDLEREADEYERIQKLLGNREASVEDYYEAELDVEDLRSQFADGPVPEDVFDQAEWDWLSPLPGDDEEGDDEDGGIPVSLYVSEGNPMAAERLNCSLMERLYEEFVPYGSDGVYGHDSESLKRINELMDLPEESEGAAVVNWLFVEGGFKGVGDDLDQKGLEVSEQEIVVENVTTGDVTTNLIGTEVDIKGSIEALGQNGPEPPEPHPDDFRGM